MEIDEKKKEISEHIELLTSLVKVNSSVSKNIKEDYTLASLGTVEKEYISENYQNAEFAKELIVRFATKGYVYEFDEKKLEYKKVPLSKEEIKYIKLMGERIFEFFMIQPHMIAILNRNKEGNFMVKGLMKSPEEEQPVVYGKEDRSVMQKIGDYFKGKKDETYEEE